MKIGPVRTIKGHYNLLHIVRLDHYERSIDKITDSIFKFENLNPQFNDSLNTVKLKLRELNHKLQSLLPKFRNKRGLFDGLGTVIKSITGNLDANDAIELNKQIDTILKNEDSMAKEINQQTKLNKQMIERFENITKHINYQQKVMVDYLNHTQEQLKNKINSEDLTIRYMQFLNQINFNIDLLNSHLSSIAEAVIFAKFNIIPKQILNQNELSEIHLIFQKQNVTIKSDEHIYELLELQAYYNDTNIIFNIQIPVIPDDIYTLFHIIPLPTRGNKVIPAKPYLIMNPYNIQYLDKKCPYIEKTYYCQTTINIEATNNSRCIGNLLNNKPAHCELNDKENFIEIFQPEPNYIILINVPETIIITTCGPKRQKISGTALIHFSECEIKINEVTYSSTTDIHWDEIHIYPTTFTEINTTTNNAKIHLKQLETYQFAEKGFVELLKPYVHYEDLYKSTGTLSIILIIITIILAIIFRRRFQGIITTSPIPTNAPANEPPRIFVWPSLNSKEGGVTFPAHQSRMPIFKHNIENM